MMETKRINATFYILDAERLSAFLEEISEFDRLWHRSPNFHSMIFGFPDPIEWPNMNWFLAMKYAEKYNLKEVKPGIFSDGFEASQ